jgi:hypothetical protein
LVESSTGTGRSDYDGCINRITWVFRFCLEELTQHIADEFVVVALRRVGFSIKSVIRRSMTERKGKNVPGNDNRTFMSGVLLLRLQA